MAGVAGTLAQFLLDAQQLVVLGYSLAPRGRPGLDLPDAGGDRLLARIGYGALAIVLLVITLLAKTAK